jgi:hypothetical protein
MPALQDLLQNMEWPAAAGAEEEEEEKVRRPALPSRKQPPSLQNFPWMAFAQLLGGWISGAPGP